MSTVDRQIFCSEPTEEDISYLVVLLERIERGENLPFVCDKTAPQDKQGLTLPSLPARIVIPIYLVAVTDAID